MSNKYSHGMLLQPRLTSAPLGFETARKISRRSGQKNSC